MKTFTRHLLLTLLFFIFPLTAQSYWCGKKIWGKIEGKYCIEAPYNGDTDTLLVYLHGLGGSEKEWFESANLQSVRDELRTHKFDAWVVTLSFGPTWLATEVPQGNLFNKMVDELLPEIETMIQPQGFTKRFVAGASMGGFNTSQIMLKRPFMFDRYMLICPAITSVGPFNPERDVIEYVRRTGARPGLVAFMLQWAKAEFPTREEWAAHNPLALAEHSLVLPRVYVSCGMSDEYGFQEGAEELFKKIQFKANFAQWVPIPGGRHCTGDPRTIIEFLTAP